MQGDVWVGGVPEVFREGEGGGFGEGGESFSDVEGGVFPQEFFYGTHGELRFDPCEDGVLVIVFDLGDELAGVDGHEGLELGAVDFSEFITGGELCGCFQHRF